MIVLEHTNPPNVLVYQRTKHLSDYHLEDGDRLPIVTAGGCWLDVSAVAGMNVSRRVPEIIEVYTGSRLS